MRRAASFAAAAAVMVATPARGQDRTAEIDRIFSFATAATPGCAVGVGQRGKPAIVRAYGLADVDRKVPLSAASRFDIGSTQKQFTAAAVLLLVEDGRIALSDDIHKYLPELPDYGHPVTVDNLLTHTSGVRDWTGMLPMAPEGTDVNTLILRQRGLNFVPGTEWSYSTSGFELAKTIVARVSGMSFAEFTRRRLFEPLGMTGSAYVPDILQAGPDAALGYQKDGDAWKPFMRLGTNRGGGAIVSTIPDLLTWNDALTTGRLGKFVSSKIQEPVRLANGRKLRYAALRGLDDKNVARAVDGNARRTVQSGCQCLWRATAGRNLEQTAAVQIVADENISSSVHQDVTRFAESRDGQSRLHSRSERNRRALVDAPEIRSRENILRI